MKKAELNSNLQYLTTENFDSPAPLLFINSPTLDNAGFLGAPTGLFYAVGPLVESVRNGHLNFPELSHHNFYDPYEVNHLNTGLIEKIGKIKPRIVGISQTSESHHIALEIARTIRAICGKDTLIIFGGPHEDEISFTLSSKQHTLSRFPELVDVVVSGDGEYALLRLIELVYPQLNQGRLAMLAAIELGKDVFRETEGRGSVFIKSENEITQLPLSGNPVNLNGLPALHYHLMEPRHLYNYDVFVTTEGRIKRCAQLMTHRGCRSACIYCTERGSFSGKTSQKIIEEISELKRSQDIEAIFFDDSTFNEDNNFVSEFCSELIRLKINDWLEWGCLTRFDSVNETILKLMRQAGCSYCYFGLEMYDSATLRKIGKATSEETIGKAIEMLHKEGMRVGVSLLFGIGETWDAVQKTTDFVRKWVKEGVIQVVSISANCYHPNSALTRRDSASSWIDYSVPPPNTGHPWDCFEEGMWYHPESFNEEYAWKVVREISSKLPAPVLVRNKIIQCAVSRAQICSLCKKQIVKPKPKMAIELV